MYDTCQNKTGDTCFKESGQCSYQPYQANFNNKNVQHLTSRIEQNLHLYHRIETAHPVSKYCADKWF